MISLILRLKRQPYKDIANAQDLIIKEIYKIFEGAVLHGGTAIWRCYSGNRFSEDIDVYIAKDSKKIDILFENLKRAGFIIKKKKVGERSLSSNLQLNRTEVRFEAIFKKESGVLKEYETIDGNFITIYSLTPENLIREKVNSYLNRLKIRDLYDIFFLLRYVQNKKDIYENLQDLIKNFKKPVDEKELRVLIMEGLIPDIEKMISYIKDILKWESKNT